MISENITGYTLQRTDKGKQRKCIVCTSNVQKQYAKYYVGLHVDYFPEWHQQNSTQIHLDDIIFMYLL